MIKSYAKKITSFLICNEIINNLELDLYVYAFETLIAFAINIFVILTISSIFGKFTQTILFLCCYCPIRQFTGGYHAENYKKCLYVFIKIYLINMLIITYVVNNTLKVAIILGILISYVGIWKLAPIEHRGNPLTIKELQRYKYVVRKLISIICFIAILSINFEKIYEYAVYIASSIIWIFIMLKMAELDRRGKSKTWKKYIG